MISNDVVVAIQFENKLSIKPLYQSSAMVTAGQGIPRSGHHQVHGENMVSSEQNEGGLEHLPRLQHLWWSPSRQTRGLPTDPELSRSWAWQSTRRTWSRRHSHHGILDPQSVDQIGATKGGGRFLQVMSACKDRGRERKPTCRAVAVGCWIHILYKLYKGLKRKIASG